MRYEYSETAACVRLCTKPIPTIMISLEPQYFSYTPNAILCFLFISNYLLLYFYIWPVASLGYFSGLFGCPQLMVMQGAFDSGSHLNKLKFAHHYWFFTPAHQPFIHHMINIKVFTCPLTTSLLIFS